MIGTIRKHSKILWWGIVVVVIFTFVVWGSKTNTDDRSAANADYGSIEGEKIRHEDMVKASNEVRLGFYLSYGEFPSDASKRMGFDLTRETYFRLFMIHKLKQEKVYVADETVAKMAAMVLRGTPVSVFEQNVLHAQGLNGLDLERFLRHELGRQQMMASYAARGKLVTPAEARVLYEREHEEVVTEAVFFNATNYVSGVKATPEAVSGFWTNQMSNYRLPERVQVSYVEFGTSNLLAQSEAELVKTNFDELITANIAQVGTNYYKDAKTPDELRARVKQDLIYRNAARIARKQANDFITAVDNMQPKKPENFDKLASDMKLTVKVTAPFDEYGPKDILVGPDFARESFLRTAEEPFSGPFSGRDGAYAIALKARIPSEIPAFATLRDRVTADFKRIESVKAARLAGEMFAQTLTNGLASGKKFSSICVDAHVKPIVMPPLSIATSTNTAIEDHVSLQQYKSPAFATQVGHASEFTLTSDGGFVVFVREKLPLELARITAELPAFMNRLRMMRQNEAQGEWFNREAQRGLGSIPYFRQPQQQQAPDGMPSS